MTPEEDKIFGAFSECPLAPLESVPTYEYMTNLNVYLNSCLSAVDCTFWCGTLGYLILTTQPAVFNTHCGTEFITPRNPDINPVMPDPVPTAAILSELVRTHKHEVRLFNEYRAVDHACKKGHFEVDPGEVLQVPLKLYHWLREGHKPFFTSTQL